jgi:hypothetical protein
MKIYYLLIIIYIQYLLIEIKANNLRKNKLKIKNNSKKSKSKLNSRSKSRSKSKSRKQINSTFYPGPSNEGKNKHLIKNN